jgi:hypothetical protein
MRTLPALLLAAAASVAGLSTEAAATARAGAAAGAAVDKPSPKNGWLMPKPVRDHNAMMRMGDKHLEWHTIRGWDRLSASERKWAEKQGWKRASIQEGQSQNGLDFLAMHRVMRVDMMEMLPEHRALFTGWSEPPTDPKSKTWPLPGGATTPFDPNMRAAMLELRTNLGKFDSEDALGLFIQTRLRPKAGDPWARSSDPRTGIHNYLHGRWSDEKAPNNLGDPSLNLDNHVFWQLHGYIDQVWSSYRGLKGLSDKDPAYLAALEKGRKEMGMDMPMGGHGHGQMKAPRAPKLNPPRSLIRKLMVNEER